MTCHYSYRLEPGSLYRFNLTKLNRVTLFETKQEYDPITKITYWHQGMFTGRKNLELTWFDNNHDNRNPWLLLVHVIAQTDGLEDMYIFFYEGTYWRYFIYRSFEKHLIPDFFLISGIE